MASADAAWDPVFNCFDQEEQAGWKAGPSQQGRLGAVHPSETDQQIFGSVEPIIERIAVWN
jgi:hypothetical protein